jgi:predicted TIM-barrel fold metal-dependent hydrolase
MSADEAHEDILDPDLPIVDPHHHCWLLPDRPEPNEAELAATARAILPAHRRYPRYMFEELSADLRSGHNVRATVGVEAYSMYRADGPPALRSLGEVEFLNGVAAIGASGQFGDLRPCAGIVGGGVDPAMGEGLEEVLVAHIQAAGGRYRGIRLGGVAWDEDETIAGPGGRPQRLLDPALRAGLGRLAPLGLSLDVWLYEPQLPDLIDLAGALPDTQIILDHLGSPLGVGRWTGRLPERFPVWRDNIRALARFPNVAVKLGGLGQPVRGFAYPRPLTSEALAAVWGPWVETCIEAFGAERCMFESNFPVDVATCSYRLMWNAFKRIADGASETEKRDLFAGAARRIYRLEV